MSGELDRRTDHAVPTNFEIFRVAKRRNVSLEPIGRADDPITVKRIDVGQLGAVAIDNCAAPERERPPRGDETSQSSENCRYFVSDIKTSCLRC
jgi:hypothetical protein